MPNVPSSKINTQKTPESPIYKWLKRAAVATVLMLGGAAATGCGEGGVVQVQKAEPAHSMRKGSSKSIQPKCPEKPILLDQTQERIEGIDYHPQKNTLAYAEEHLDGLIYIASLEDNKLKPVQKLPAKGYISHVHFSPNGQHLLVYDFKSLVADLIDLQSKARVEIGAALGPDEFPEIESVEFASNNQINFMYVDQGRVGLLFQKFDGTIVKHFRPNMISPGEDQADIHKGKIISAYNLNTNTNRTVDSQLEEWDLEGRLVRKRHLGSPIMTNTYSPSGNQVVYITENLNEQLDYKGFAINILDAKNWDLIGSKSIDSDYYAFMRTTPSANASGVAIYKQADGDSENYELAVWRLKENLLCEYSFIKHYALESRPVWIDENRLVFAQQNKLYMLDFNK